MPEISDFFDETNLYKEVDIQQGGLVNPDDINWIQDINNYDRREMAKFLQGYQLKIQAMTNAPVLKVKANNDLVEGQVITLEMIDATHVKWKKNSGAFSGSIAVTSDDMTWNTVGTSGLDVVFSSTAVAADVSEVWVAQGMRLLGGLIDAPVASSFRLNVGKWNLLGEFEDFTIAKTVAGTSDDDYLYLKVETAEVTYLTDSEIGTRINDGNYDPNSPIMHNRTYTLLAGAAFPDNTTSPLVSYIIVGKVINAVAGTFTYMWPEANDIQKIMRIYGDTEAPSTPTGLALTTGSELGYVTGTVERATTQMPLNGYLEATCDLNNEIDTNFYEFKFVRLATPGGAITTDKFTVPVYANSDAGGMSVPLGVTFRLRNQTLGVPYGVFVRAVDYAGNVSSWSSRVDAVVGGTTSAIGVAVAGPTFVLTDTAGFVGVDVTVSGLPASCEGYGIWINEGSYPTCTPGTEYGTYNGSVGTVSIPWKESGRPYIRIRGFDANGIYQTLSSEDTISLANSAQLSAETHNDSSASHGGLIGDMLSITERYGSLYKAWALVESQGFALADVYVVSNQGDFYSTFQGALDAIAANPPDLATILICPDHNDSGGTVTFPDLYSTYAYTKIVVQGFGADCFILDDIDVCNVAAMDIPLSSPLTTKAAQVEFKDLLITGRVYSTKTAVPYACVGFTNCEIISSEAANPLVDLDATAGGGHYFFAKNCNFINYGTANVLYFGGYADIFIENCNVCLYNAVDGTAIYFDSPSTSMRRIDGSKIDVNGCTTGYSVAASGAINLMMNRTDYRRANDVNTTLVIGSVDTNSVHTVDFIYN